MWFNSILKQGGRCGYSFIGRKLNFRDIWLVQGAHMISIAVKIWKCDVFPHSTRVYPIVRNKRTMKKRKKCYSLFFVCHSSYIRPFFQQVLIVCLIHNTHTFHFEDRGEIKGVKIVPVLKEAWKFLLEPPSCPLCCHSNHLILHSIKCPTFWSSWSKPRCFPDFLSSSK